MGTEEFFLVFGGYSPEFVTVSSAWMYLYDQNAWFAVLMQGAQLPALTYASAVMLNNNTQCVFYGGGYQQNDEITATFSSITYGIDVTTWTVSVLSQDAVPLTRIGHSAVTWLDTNM